MMRVEGCELSLGGNTVVSVDSKGLSLLTGRKLVVGGNCIPLVESFVGYNRQRGGVGGCAPGMQWQSLTNRLG
jgi:hypothetical protein